MTSGTINYTKDQMIKICYERHVWASERYLKDKDFASYKSESDKVESALKRNNIPLDEYWRFVMK